MHLFGPSPTIPRKIDFLSFHIRLVHLKTFRGREKRLMMIVTRPTQSLKLLIFIDFDWISWANLALKFFNCAQSITTCYKSSLCNKSQIHISGVLIIYPSHIWISKLTFEKPKTKKNYLHDKKLCKGPSINDVSHFVGDGVCQKVDVTP